MILLYLNWKHANLILLGCNDDRFKYTVNPVLSDHLKIDKTKVLMENGSLMHVGSNAECSPWSILHYCQHALSAYRYWKAIYGVLLDWPLKTGFAVYGSHIFYHAFAFATYWGRCLKMRPIGWVFKHLLMYPPSVVQGKNVWWIFLQISMCI